jgi:methionyl-tRNA formyltransferase
MFFVRELVPLAAQLCVVIETTAVMPPFEVSHPFETARDTYELDVWFDGKEVMIRELTDTMSVATVNDSDTSKLVNRFAPEVTIVFGTRKLNAALIRAAGPVVLNLHGGDPEYYRGLDSHLWAIYHGDFDNLVTTLHVLNETLDDGPIVGIRAIPLQRDMRLHHLRRRNTECAVELTRVALQELRHTGQIVSRKQRQAGRYYSFMPSVLKDLCVRRFEKHCASLS